MGTRSVVVLAGLAVILAGLAASFCVLIAACTPGRADERTPRSPSPTPHASSGSPAAMSSVGGVPSVPSVPGVPSAPGAPVALPMTPLADAGPTVASCVDGKPFDQKVLGERVAFLASEEMAGRVPGSAGDIAAREFIVEKFRCLGLTAGFDDSYEQPFVDAEKQATANIVGYIPGTDAMVGSEIVVIGAHHDHLGNKLLGANDNASGVVALLAIAQSIRQRETAPRRTIAFIAFGAEEQGMVGSEFFVKHAPGALPMDKVVQYINLDMVGSHSSKGFVAAMGTFPKFPARKLLTKLDDGFPALNVGVGGRARGSDHLPFCKLGIPYVFFWTPDARCYHAACDKADKIDLPRMADIAALAGELTRQLADSELDLAASRTKLGCYGK